MSWSTNHGFEDLIYADGGGGDGEGSFTFDKKNTSGYGNQSFPSDQRAPPSSSGKMAISELSLGIPGMQLTAIVIAKEDPRSFPNKKDPGTERHVLSFTIRDSPMDTVNVTCWGNETYTRDLAERFHIGDVVELHQFVVQSKPTDGSSEKFRPSTSSLFQLSVSENRSTVNLCMTEEADELTALSHVPTKQTNDYYTISDVITNGQQLHGHTINMLGVIRSVGQVREITTKLGKKLKRCEVRLLDETAPSFLLNLWSEELITMAQTWTPKDNVIFAADIRVTFDDYKKTMVGTANSRTILTVNPDTREAHSIFQYAQTVELDPDKTPDEFTSDFSRVDLESIHTVFTAAEARRRLKPTADGATEYGVLYCHVTRFDIDGDATVSITRCSKCRRRVSRDSMSCENQDCPQGSLTRGGHLAAQQETSTQYHVMVDLSDHTGTLASCLLTPDAAADMLRCPITEFNLYDEDQKTSLKWEYLLEKCKVYIKMSTPTYERAQPSVRVLSCTRADLQEAIKYLH